MATVSSVPLEPPPLVPFQSHLAPNHVMLAGIPNEDQIEVLSKLNRPYINRIIDYIGGVDPRNLNLNTFRLRTQFIETFDKNLQTILLNTVKNDDIHPIDANSATVENRLVQRWNNSLMW